MEMLDVLRKRDIVRVRLDNGREDEEWCLGEVVACSGSSLALHLLDGGMVRTAQGGLIGSFLPLTIDFDRGCFEGLITGDIYEVEKQAARVGDVFRR